MDRECVREECTEKFTVGRKSDPKKYCSKSCAARVNNTSHPKRSPEGSCKKCGKTISTRTTYCGGCFYSIPNRIVVNPPNAREKECLTCDKIFETAAPNAKYCSSKCRNRSHNTKSICDCGSVKSSNSSQCLSCYRSFVQQSNSPRSAALLASWLSGEWSGGSVRKLSQTVRRYLLEKSNYCCEECGFNTPHPSDGNTILEIDHIDGDGSNHSPENLRVLCPNCHALTPTYRARNIGNGRKVYYLRVQRGGVDEVGKSVV